MAKLSVLSWIGNAAARLCGKRGDVSQAAQQAGCSRQSVYDHAQKVHAAVAAEHSGGPSRAQLIQENQAGNRPEIMTQDLDSPGSRK